MKNALSSIFFGALAAAAIAVSWLGYHTVRHFDKGPTYYDGY